MRAARFVAPSLGLSLLGLSLLGLAGSASAASSTPSSAATVEALVGGWEFGYFLPPVASSSHFDFTQARITAEFGTSPWSPPGLRLPSSRLTVMSFGVPQPPPYQAEVANFAGHSGWLVQAWWTHSKVATAPGPGVSRVSNPTAGGSGFTVYLER